MLRTNLASFSIALLLAMTLPGYAEDPGSNEAIQKSLESQYALTKTTADRSDIVTAGAVVVLQKDNLLMAAVTSNNLYQNTYKEGKITQNTVGKTIGKLSRFHVPGAAAPSTGTRTFVAGEKMWVTKIEVKDDKVVFTLFTDAISDVRYAATLTFFGHGRPPADQVEKAVAEVFKVQPADDNKDATAGNKGAPAGGQQAPAATPAPAAPAPAAPAPAADAPPPPIAPPPPVAPDPEPKKIELGQTPDQVTAAFGPPQSIAKISAKKEIFIYKDLKVTFVNGKVSDVQ